MYAYSEYLKVENSFLLGKKNFWSKWQKIETENILGVIVHGPVNPYIEVITAGGRFFVGALRKQYEGVAAFLSNHTKYNIEANAKHKLNNAIYNNRYYILRKERRTGNKNG
jgi:hypothetical protein